MSDLKAIDDALTRFVRPESFPIAVKMCRAGEPIPERSKRPLRDLKVQVTTCMGYTMARRYGWSIAMSRVDVNCPLSKAVYGLEEAVSYFTDGCTCHGMYTETLEAGARSEAEVAKFSWKEYESILCAPLPRAEFAPDVVVVYGNSAQVMLLVVAALYRRGGRIHSSFSGRIDCSDSVIQTMQTDAPQVILPCYGDRVFGQTQDYEMGFSFPSHLAGDIIDGLEGAYRGGIRYPIPNFLRYQPSYPESYTKLEEIWSSRRPASDGKP
jgi:uncharacterized protein (DUF169 family)